MRFSATFGYASLRIGMTRLEGISRSAGLLPGLDLDVDVDERDRGRGDAGDAAGLSERARTDAGELFVHLAREARDFGVVEPVRDGALLRALEPLDGLGLLVEIAGVLDFGFDGA